MIMPRGYFASDLHLLANRSRAARYREAIGSAASRAAFFVLGGDIFDFKWATTPTSREAVDQAVQWLDRLAADSSECHFHYLLGNHDYYQPFIHRLDELASTAGNLSWHRFHLRLGGSVFLHGDVANRRMDARRLAAARARTLYKKKKGRFRSRMYDSAVLTRVHKPLPYLVYPKKLVAKRILAYLEAVGHGPGSGVGNVYFGHTHRPMSDYRHGGLTFHNGGAPIKGLNFRILEADDRS